MLTVSALAVDCPSQLICAWIFMCSMTKLKKNTAGKSAQPSPIVVDGIGIGIATDNTRLYDLHIFHCTCTSSSSPSSPLSQLSASYFVYCDRRYPRLRGPYIIVCSCTSQASPTHIVALLFVLGSTYFCSWDKVSGLTLLTVLEGLFHEPKKSIKNRNQIKACAKK